MHPDFDLPTRGRIDGRTSTITAAFFQAITPVRIPSDAEVDDALAVLGMTTGDCRCAYCGDPRTEWDHFRPVVKDRQPTGYITEIANLVPSCGKCNQSKGNKDWREWMLSDARLSPQRRQISDLAARVARLEAFAKWRRPIQIDYAETVGAERWGKYQELLSTAVSHLVTAQGLALELLTLSNQKLAGKLPASAVDERRG
jgi:hypothetical protein